jgi:hypothetical protein
VRRPLEEHSAVACDLESQKRRSDVQADHVDGSAGGTRQGDLEGDRSLASAIEEDADVEIAAWRRLTAGGGAE